MSSPTPPIRLSRQASLTPESPITQLMASALSNPSLISLAAGFVDAGSLPAAGVAQAAAAILADSAAGRSALQYGTTAGYAPLRDKSLALFERWEGLSRRELRLRTEDVVLSTGSQQMLYILAEALLDEGDIVINSAPSYFVYSGLLAGFGVEVRSIPDDDGGMCPDRLEALLSQLQEQGQLHRVKLIYAVSYYQNPTGVSIAADRRARIVELAKRFSTQHRILILEDAAYRELRYDGPDLPSLKRYDPDNTHVVFTTTYSKPFAPGLKTGWTIVPADLMPTVLKIKGGHDFGSANFSQHVLDRVIADGSYDRQVETLRAVYRRKRDVMLASMAEHFGERPGWQWVHPQGGLYVWATLPADIDTRGDGPLWRAVLRHGMLYVPGDLSYTARSGQTVPTNTMRLSFGVVAEPEIRQGIARLAAAVEEVQTSSAPPSDAAQKSVKPSTSTVMRLTAAVAPVA